jgi:hypothetical protein
MAGLPVLVVIGTGRLARVVCYSLAVLHPGALRVVVIGRRLGAAVEVCHVASARAAATGRGATVRFDPRAAEGGSLDDLATLATLVDLADRGDGESPAGVLLCASTQSPWERLAAPSAWTALVERAGFGITVPFQAELALAVGARVPRDAWLVNACLPDAVNAVLAASGVPVLCGVGNVGLLAAGLQTALGLPDQRRLRVLAHHVHLHEPANAEDEAMAWCDDEPIEVGALLATQRATSRPELNQVTGLTAALLVSALLSGTELQTSLPGPLGLPGGYPVRLKASEDASEDAAADAADAADARTDAADARTDAATDVETTRRLELRLPPGMAVADAVARNQRWALADGAMVDGQRVEFSDLASAELSRLAPELAGGFELADLDAVTRRMHELREQLRRNPPAANPIHEKRGIPT